MTILKEFNEVKQNIQIKKAELEAANRIDEQKLEELKAQYEQFVYQSDFTNAEKTKQAIKSVEGSMETRQDILDVISDSRNAGIVEEGKRVVQKFKAEKSKLETELEKRLRVADKKRYEYMAELDKIAEINRNHFALIDELQVIRPLANWDNGEGKDTFGINLKYYDSREFRKLFDFNNLSRKIQKEVQDVMLK